MTDFIQFGLAMLGSVALAWFALVHPAIGGVDGLLIQLPSPTFELLPRIGAGAQAGETLALPVAAFLGYLGVQWWASWYPRPKTWRWWLHRPADDVDPR